MGLLLLVDLSFVIRDYELIFNALTLQPGKAVAQMPICKVPTQLKPDSIRLERETDFSSHLHNHRSWPRRLSTEVCRPIWAPLCCSGDGLTPRNLRQKLAPPAPESRPWAATRRGSLLGDLRPGSQDKHCVTHMCHPNGDIWPFPWTMWP